MNSHRPSQPDSTVSAPMDAAMQELKGALQSTIVPLAGIWVAAGKALISGASEASLSAKPLETWAELKHAAKEAMEPLVGVKKKMPDDHEATERSRRPRPPAKEPRTARGTGRTKAHKSENTVSAEAVGGGAKKSGTVQSRSRAPRAKAS